MTFNEENIIVRKVKPEDNLELAKLIKEVFVEYDAPKIGTVYSDPTTDNLFQLFRTPKSVLWVAEKKGNEILGCCGIYPTKGLPETCVELVKFYLSPAARGKGIGKRLMELSIQSAIKYGYRSLYIESLKEFSTAVHIYEKQGFKKLSKQIGKSGHPTCNIWMLKEIN